MEKGVIQFAVLFMLLCFLSTFRSVYGLKFQLIREECFSQVLSSENYSVWGTHSVVNTGRSWKKGYYDDAVKLLVIDPTGNVVFNSHGNLSWKFELKPSAGGVYLFCFINSAPRNLPVEFDLNIVSNTGNDVSEHAKHDDFEILMLAVEELKYALKSILSEQDDLASQMKDQAIINEKMSKRAITKAMSESVALIGASVLQIFILRRFFEKKFSYFFLPK